MLKLITKRMNKIKNKMMEAVLVSIIGKEMSMKSILYYARNWILSYSLSKEAGTERETGHLLLTN